MVNELINEWSGWWSVLSGVPQLLVLGCIVFNIFTSAPGDGMAGTSVDDAEGSIECAGDLTAIQKDMTS